MDQEASFPGVDHEFTGVEELPRHPPKVFAQPYRLALKRGDSVVWLEVRTLAGLRNVFKKLASGELQEIDRSTSVEMQLWGHLAEHTGFLRVQGRPSMLAAGIQPLGEDAVDLVEDLSSIIGGGDSEALDMLGTMQDTLTRKPLDKTPINETSSAHEFVKPDGVNLTEKGEDVLHELVLGVPANKTGRTNRQESIAFEKARENAIEIFLATPAPTVEERAAEDEASKQCVDHGEKPLHEICKLNAIPPSEPPKIGLAAMTVGRLVAEVGRGLDNADDKAVRDAAEKALSIMGIVDNEHIEEEESVPFAGVEEFLSYYGVSIGDLRLLTNHPQDSADAAERARSAYRMMQERDMTVFVEQSKKEETDEVGPTYEAPDPRDPYGRKSNEDNGQQPPPSDTV